MIKLKEMLQLSEMPHTNYGEIPADLHFEKYIKDKSEYLKCLKAFWDGKLCGYSTKHKVFMLITPGKLKKMGIPDGESLPPDYVRLPDEWEKYIKFVVN